LREYGEISRGERVFNSELELSKSMKRIENQKQRGKDLTISKSSSESDADQLN
jgi:hypothetical protein